MPCTSTKKRASIETQSGNQSRRNTDACHREIGGGVRFRCGNGHAWSCSMSIGLGHWVLKESSPRIMASPSIALLDHDVPIVPLPMHEQQQERGDGKEDAVHDTKSKACLEHGAILIGAVCICDVSELVYTSDQGADEADVDEGDENGGIAGGFAAEHGSNGPGSSEDGDDEENTTEGLG